MFVLENINKHMDISGVTTKNDEEINNMKKQLLK